MDGMIFDLQRFSIHDGPGIRTTVFFKGCNLRCKWCHNPESANGFAELQWYPDKCIGCGACASACPSGATSAKGFDRSLCVNCGKCAETCYAEARMMAGKRMSVDEVLDTVLRDELFYKNSGGGMTCSGGECMLQIDFLAALLEAAKGKGLHTTVDTAGNVPWESFERVLPFADLFLYDVKAADPARHQQWIGADNARILENLRRLTAAGARVWVRVPTVPGVNADEAEMRAIGQIALDAGVELIELNNYHRLGDGKYQALGRENPMPSDVSPCENDELNALKKLLHGMGLKVAGMA